jgi:hypothetical protein
MSTTATPHKQKPSTNNHQIDSNDYDLFSEVVREYGSLVFCQSLISNNPDPIAFDKKRTSPEANFVRDVESATNCAFQGTDLFDDWLRLAKNDNLPKFGVRQQIIRLCAPVYRERGLSPDSYVPSSRHTGGKSNGWNQTHYRHSVVGGSALCKKHGLQTVTKCFKDDAGEILQLQCGCNRRMDNAVAVAIRGTVVCIATPPAAAPLSFGDDTTMLGWFGTAA